MNEITNSPDDKALAEHTLGIRVVETRLLGDSLPLPDALGRVKPPRPREACTADIIQMG